MGKKLYEVLGVPAGASAEEIRTAYRKLAKGLHPDRHPDDARAEARFKEVTAAYEILKDKDKRARYDRGEIDETGQERPRYEDMFRQGGGFARGAGGFRTGTGAGAGAGGFEDIISELFGAGAGAAPGAGGFSRNGSFGLRGDDVRYRLNVSFMDAARGATRALNLPGGKSLSVNIPAGIESGQTLRLRGQGEPAAVRGGTPGDALIEVTVETEPGLRREGLDVYGDLPVPLAIAALGGKVEAKTVHGAVKLNIPAGTDSGKVLRLRGKGVQRQEERGDHLAKVLITLPKPLDPALLDVLRQREVAE